MHCHAIKDKIKSHSLDKLKSRNCDIIDEKEDSSPSSRCVHCPKVETLVEMFQANLEPSMEPPCWCSVVHQYGDQKIVLTSGTYFGYLGQ